MNDTLRTFLDAAGIRYELLNHPTVYTAQERAATTHVSGRHVAKAVVVRDGDWFGMAVLPAGPHLDVSALARLTRRAGLRLATEDEFSHLFPDCERGAVPPFGHLYGIDVFLDRALADSGEIVLPTGSHAADIRMGVGDYLHVAKPAVGALSTYSRAA